MSGQIPQTLEEIVHHEVVLPQLLAGERKEIVPREVRLGGFREVLLHRGHRVRALDGVRSSIAVPSRGADRDAASFTRREPRKGSARSHCLRAFVQPVRFLPSPRCSGSVALAGSMSFGRLLTIAASLCL